MLSLSDLTPVTIDDKDDLSAHYSKYPPEHSDYLLGTMLTWQHYMCYRRAWINSSLVIMTEHEGKRALRPPVGPPDPDALVQVLALSRELKLDPGLSMVGSRTKGWTNDVQPGLRMEPHRDYFEYVYLSSVLSELSGKRYLNVRNYLNKFRREHNHSIERMDGGNLIEAKEFLSRWCIQKGCRDEAFLVLEKEANTYALDHLDELGMKGLIIRVGDSVEAFSVYEQMTNEMTVIHHEKANAEISGLYQAINNETAKALSVEARLINRESDMGIPGLRNVKERYGPDHMLEVHDAWFT